MHRNEQVNQLQNSTMSAIKTKASGPEAEKRPSTVIDRSIVETLLSSWPSVPQRAANDMLAKYGEPNEATDSRLIWFNRAPWKRITVYRDEVPHNYPKPHVDVLEQVIDYKVPLEKVSDVMAEDGSVIIERTNGEVKARCDMEEMNILSLNVMHEIVTGKRTVEEARKHHAETAMGYTMNRPSPYTESLLFGVPADTADQDEAIMAGPAVSQLKEKVKDVIWSDKSSEDTGTGGV
jgi:hypothetical protein